MPRAGALLDTGGGPVAGPGGGLGALRAWLTMALTRAASRLWAVAAGAPSAAGTVIWWRSRYAATANAARRQRAWLRWSAGSGPSSRSHGSRSRMALRRSSADRLSIWVSRAWSGSRKPAGTGPVRRGVMPATHRAAAVLARAVLAWRVCGGRPWRAVLLPGRRRCRGAWQRRVSAALAPRCGRRLPRGGVRRTARRTRASR
jgi:hypothetical protein